MKLTEQQIADQLRAMRPAPDPGFAAELDKRAAGGFGRRDGARLADRIPKLSLRRLTPALGAAATLLIVTGVAVSQLGDSGDMATTIERAPQADQVAPSSGGGEAAGAGAAIAPAPPTVVPPSQDLAPGAAKRQVERNVSMTLSTEPGELRDVADGVVEVTDRYSGFVVSSSVQSGDDDARARFDLRIPTARLQDALADLSGLAHVSARNEGTLDITASVQDARRQLEEAETAEERELARGQLQALKQRADLTAISVTVLGDAEADGSWSLGEAADDALSVLRTIAGIALVSLAILAPLALLIAVAYFAWRAITRRRRQSALDQA